VASPPDPNAAVPPAARDAILAWYDATGRQLAFRATADPYAVLVSELMAQQTQAERAASAWTAWMARWPTVADLAAAPVADVLRAWQGLGYNRRALNLHRAARAIVAEHGGVVPSDVAALEALPGVGPYTARAVAAIAFRIPVGAVDTNVRRVLGRVAAGGADAIPGTGMQALADAVVPRERPDAWTHALMDIGQRLCRPATPRCADCPAVAWCRYAAGERPAEAGEATKASGAAPIPGSRAVRRPEPAFLATNRWLRGRILDRARAADDGAWVSFRESIGDHGPRAVREAVATMASEGLLEARVVPAAPNPGSGPGRDTEDGLGYDPQGDPGTVLEARLPG
jgi:A/G-specific adenine glycosylase